MEVFSVQGSKSMNPNSSWPDQEARRPLDARANGSASSGKVGHGGYSTAGGALQPPASSSITAKAGREDSRTSKSDAPPSVASGSSIATASVPGTSTGAPQGVQLSNYQFFVRYTYSNECALLAYNFHKLVTKLGIFEQFTYRDDHRLISITLAYIFYRYQVHHCDMALDLAVTLVYLEDVKASPSDMEALDHERSRDAFNLICYLAFLAHTFNADRTIRLTDWFKEIGWRSFKNCAQLNEYVFFLFVRVRKYCLRVSETRVKRYIQKLCSVPSQVVETDAKERK